VAISFNSIATDIRTPGQYIEFDGSRAIRGLASLPHKALIIAPRLTTGSVAAATPFLISSKAAAEAGFGRHSIGSFMAKAFKDNNPYTEVWGIGVADAGGGTAATGLLTFSGTATAAGTIVTYIAGVRIPVAVTVGMTAAQFIVALVAASADYELPVTLADGTGDTIDVTAKNKGTTGNKIDIRFSYNEGEVIPAGLTAAVTTPMASGATDGSVSGAITALGDVQYHTIVSAWDDDTNLDLIEAELLTRWGPMEQREGHVFAATKGTQGTMSTAGNARNSFLSSVMGTGLSPSPTYSVAAMVAARDAAQCEVDPARPRQTLQLTGMLPPSPTQRLTRTERNTLLTDGISTFTVDGAGNCLIERLITTYQTNSGGIADVTYLDITTPRTLAALRYTQRARIALKFPRHKLASDGTNFGPGQAVVTPAIIKSELIALFQQWEEVGWVEGLDQFKQDLIVERNASDLNRVDVLMSPDLVNSFFVYAANIQFLL
jgi:phage tail sheath gpL-like